MRSPRPTRWLPAGTVPGRATGQDNCCLAHAILQQVDLSPAGTPGGAWADEVRRSVAARAALVADDPSVADGGFLTLAEHWWLLLIALGKDPAEYRVTCYTPQHGGEAHGDGPRELRLYNGDYAHYVPLVSAPVPQPAVRAPKRRR